MQSTTAKKPLNVYIDENIAPQMAHAFSAVQSHLNKEEKRQIEVFSIKEKFGKGALDEEWIPKVGKEHGIVITQDRRIQQCRHQQELYKAHGVGIIFLKAQKGGMSFWDMFKHLVKWWDEIKRICVRNKTPFAYRQPGINQGFEDWN